MTRACLLEMISDNNYKNSGVCWSVTSTYVNIIKVHNYLAYQFEANDTFSVFD